MTTMSERTHRNVRESNIETLNEEPEKSVTRGGERRRSRALSLGRFCHAPTWSVISHYCWRKKSDGSSAHGALENRLESSTRQSPTFAMRTAAAIWDAHTSSSRPHAVALTRHIDALINTIEQSESDRYLTSTTGTESQSLFDREQQNLELLQLVWLTSDGSGNDNIPTIDLLRLIIDYTKIFSDHESCLHHIQKTIATTTFFVSSIHQRRIVEDIVKMENIEGIYLYYNGNEKPLNHEWTSHYPKIETVGVGFDNLLFRLKRNVEKCMERNRAIGIFQSLTENTTEGHRSWWIKFIDIVLHLPYTKTSFDQFIVKLQPYYQGNKPIEKTLEIFEKTYNPRDAVKWYTEDSFLYRLVNNALRRRNIELMFLMGFFLQDMYRQVAEEYGKQKIGHFKQPILKLFRGQIMGTFEFNSMSHSLTEIVVLHSFFSTSGDREAVLCFLNSDLRRDSTQKNVLFEIEIDIIRRIKSRPYADIERLSTKPGEKEVLFMPGTQFRIYNISYDESIHCWIVKMVMISNDNKDILVIDDAISARKKLKNLFNALCYDRKSRIPKRDELKVMFTHFDDLLAPDDKTWVRAVHLHVEGLAYPTLTSTHYTQALAMWSSIMTDDINGDELNCFIDISRLHKDFAYYYEMSDAYNIRDEHLGQAGDFLQLALQRASTDTELMIIEDELADLYNEKLNGNNISIVIKYKELSLQRALNFYSADDEAIVSRLTELADHYDSINEWDAVLRYFQRALEIHLQQAEPYYISIIKICDKMAKLYIENKHDVKSALIYQLIGHQCILKQEKKESELQPLKSDYLTDNNMVAESHVKLGSLYTKLTQYDSARENLKTASKLYTYYNRDDKDVKLGDIEKKLADICEALQQYSLAYQHLTAALKLYKKRILSLNGSENMNVQDGGEDDSLRRAIEAARCVTLGAGEITKKIEVIEEKLRKMETLMKKKKAK